MSARDLIPNPFDFEGHSVRVVELNGEPQFHAGDVCAALGFANPRQALISHVEEDDVQKLDTIDSIGRIQLVNHVNEPGVYALAMGATKEVAKRFKHWVTHEVLPSIRRTGSYALPAEDKRRMRHEAAASYKVMSEMLLLRREADGKTSAPHHFMNEARVVNLALGGQFKGLDRDKLTIEQLDLLGKLEVRNSLMIGMGIDYQERKAKLQEIAGQFALTHPNMPKLGGG